MNSQSAEKKTNSEFKKKNLFELQKLNLEELTQYYVELRKYQYDNSIPMKGIKIRKKIHKLPLNLIKIDRFLSKETITIIGDKREKTESPIIYACTHIGGNDIQRTFEAIKDHAYLFLGDPKGIYCDVSGVLLYLNGVIFLETDNKTDRHIAKNRSIELLNNGGNLLIYPEGAWNITENLPVLKLYTGTVNIALETGAEIVPIAIEQYDNDFYINIGKNIKSSSFSKETISEFNSTLRDSLATLKWEIWEQRGVYPLNTISNDFRNSFKQDIVDRCEYGFTVDDVYNTMYKDPNEPSPEEVFSFVKKRGINH